MLLHLSPVYLTHVIYRYSRRQGQRWWAQAFRFSGKTTSFSSTQKHIQMTKREEKKKSILFPSRQSKSRNEPTVCTLCTNVHLQIPLSVEGIWRLLNGNCVSRMCDCECNKGVLSFCCACELWVSYPLRSSLSSAATLRSSASISSSSCRLKNSCTSLESVHL